LKRDIALVQEARAQYIVPIHCSLPCSLEPLYFQAFDIGSQLIDIEIAI
jgi:hypothetical protein